MDMENANSLLSAALNYSERGFSVIPLGPKGKEPLIPWTDYQKRPATEEKIKSWWAEWPDANVGIITGAVSKIIAVDVDSVEGVDFLIGKLGENPGLSGEPNFQTVANKTGRGYHATYRHPGFSVKNSAGKISVGIDIRGDGGYIVAPPSIHANGRTYQWLEGLSIDEVQVALPPPWLLEFLSGQTVSEGSENNQTPSKSKSGSVLKGIPSVIADGTRNSTLTKEAGRLFGKGLRPDKVQATLMGINIKNCKPQLSEGEIARIVKSIGHREAAKTSLDKLSPDFFKQRTFFPNLLAKRLQELGHFICSPIDDSGKGVRLLVYQNGVFGNGQKLARSFAYGELGDRVKSEYIIEAIELLKERTKTSEDQLNPKVLSLVNVENGMLDWQTGKLLPHSADYLSTFQIHASWNPDVKSPVVDQFLRDVFPEDALPLAEELLGHLLLPTTRHQKAFMLLGSGANGKSTFLNLLASFLGAEHISRISLQDLCGNRFALAELQGKLTNIYPDLPSKALEQTDTFKAIVTGDSIKAERKFQHPFNIKPIARLLFSANELPRSNDSTYAFFRRWVIIPFCNVFDGNKADKNILEKLTTAEGKSALLNKAIEGLKRLEERQGFSECPSILKTTEQYRKQCDSAYEYIQERLERRVGTKLSKDEVYRNYRAWCMDRGIYQVGQTSFNTKLVDTLGVKESRPTTADGKRLRVWEEVGWKEAGGVPDDPGDPGSSHFLPPANTNEEEKR